MDREMYLKDLLLDFQEFDFIVLPIKKVFIKSFCNRLKHHNYIIKFPKLDFFQGFIQ